MIMNVFEFFSWTAHALFGPKAVHGKVDDVSSVASIVSPSVSFLPLRFLLPFL